MSLFLNSIDLRPSAIQNFKPNNVDKANNVDKVLDIALKIIATATIVVPLSIGFYEYFRPRISNVYDQSGIHANSYLVKTAWTIAALGLNILYYGTLELWARYPTRFLEQLSADTEIEIDKLRSYQIPDYLRRKDVLTMMTSLKVHQCIQKNPHASSRLLKELSDDQFRDYIFDLTDNKKGTIGKLPYVILESLSDRLTNKDVGVEMRVVAYALPYQKLLNHSQTTHFLHTLTGPNLVKKFKYDLKFILSFIFSTPFEKALEQISKDQRSKLLEYFTNHPEKAKNLSKRSALILLKSHTDRALRNQFLECLDESFKAYFIKHYSELTFSLKGNDQLIASIPATKEERRAFLVRMTDEQFDEMNLELFDQLFDDLLGQPERLRQVNLNLIKEFILQHGLVYDHVLKLPLKIMREALKQLTDEEKIALMQRARRSCNKLQDEVILILLKTPLNREARRKFYSSLSWLAQAKLQSSSSRLVFSLNGNDQLLALIPEESADRASFLEKFSKNQLSEMNFEVFDALYWDLVKYPIFIKHVKASVVAQHIAKYGIEDALFKALPDETLHQLDIANTRICRRTVETSKEYDFRFRLVSHQTSTGYQPCLHGFVGFLRFMLDDLTVRTITTTKRPNLVFSLTKPFFTSVESENTEEYDLSFHLVSEKWDPNSLKRTLLRLTNDQIYNMVWKHVPREYIGSFIEKLLTTIKNADIQRHNSLESRFQLSPSISTEHSDAEIEGAFKALDVPRNCNFKRARKAYLLLSRKHHPDKEGNKEMFQEIANAWLIVKKTLESK